MPWANENGSKRYITSLYAKEELPTWSEVYTEFYKQDIFSYDPLKEEEQELDPYWKIPKRKRLLASVCNQLNKMLYEDGLREKAIEYASKRLRENCVDVKFICESVYEREVKYTDEKMIGERWTYICTSKNLGTGDPPPIYTWPMPNGKPNIFITSDRIPRININDLDRELKLTILLMYDEGNDHVFVSDLTYDNEHTMPYFIEILDVVIEEIKKYFEGEGVGWKDEDGHLIDKKPNPQDYDSAL